MLIGGGDISNDMITLDTCFSLFAYIHACFRFALVGKNLTAQSMGCHRGIVGGIQFQRHTCQLSFLFLPCCQSIPECLFAG